MRDLRLFYQISALICFIREGAGGVTLRRAVGRCHTFELEYNYIAKLVYITVREQKTPEGRF